MSEVRTVVAARWLLLGGCCSVVAARWLLLGGCCSVVAARWLLLGGCCSVVAARWLPARWLLLGGCCSVVACSVVVRSTDKVPGSVVVVGAADVLVVERRRWFVGLHGSRQRQLIEPVLQDRFDVRVRARARGERAFAGSFDPVERVATCERLEPAARSKAMLGMRSVGENCAHERERVRANFCRPALEAGVRLLGVLAVRSRHVRRVGRRPAVLEAAHV